MHTPSEHSSTSIIIIIIIIITTTTTTTTRVRPYRVVTGAHWSTYTSICGVYDDLRVFTLILILETKNGGDQ